MKPPMVSTPTPRSGALAAVSLIPSTFTNPACTRVLANASGQLAAVARLIGGLPVGGHARRRGPGAGGPVPATRRSRRDCPTRSLGFAEVPAVAPDPLK